MDEKKVGTDVPTSANLIPTYIKNELTCPAGGAYTVNAVDTNPECPNVATMATHKL